ncbi:glutaminyl-peptide cyclotransferase-like isoform X2 [Eurosta solidaginis]
MHPVIELSREEFLKYGQLADVKHLHNAMQKILIPRVVGTIRHKQVRNYISDNLRKMQWSVEYDTFRKTVPILKKVQFHNIIAKLNPDAKRFLVLTCHYDSKYFKYDKFVGAIDGVPCAMLLNMAHVLQAALEPFRKTELSLMFIFFDGKESIVAESNGLYGARNLANSWHADGTLKKLDILVDLDLIGSPNSTFYSFFKNTDEWFNRFIALEERLSNAKILYRCINPKRYFGNNPIRSHYQQSDHLPFLKRKVPILHVTPPRVPSVWHRKVDVESNIDHDATEDISRIIRLFIMEYLNSGINK